MRMTITAYSRAAAGKSEWLAGDHGAAARRTSAAASPSPPAAARARAALLVLSLYEIHERHHLDSAGNTNGIAARDFVACVLRFAITRETQ